MVDLIPFCDTKRGRYAIHQPWRVGDFVYATDGRIIVEVGAELAPDIGLPSGRVPVNLDEVLGGNAKRWQKCPQAVEACAECGGTGDKKCPTCGGGGGCICHQCTTAHTCGDCGGTGRERGRCCQACVFHFAGEQFQPKYIRLIAALPGVRVAMHKSAVGKLLFKFDGGRGALMACTPD